MHLATRLDGYAHSCMTRRRERGRLDRVFPHHLHAAPGDPPDWHPHLAAPNGVDPRVLFDPAGDLHEVHQGDEVGLSWPIPRCSAAAGRSTPNPTSPPATQS